MAEVFNNRVVVYVPFRRKGNIIGIVFLDKLLGCLLKRFLLLVHSIAKSFLIGGNRNKIAGASPEIDGYLVKNHLHLLDDVIERNSDSVSGSSFFEDCPAIFGSFKLKPNSSFG